jgi:hypothetical protein
MQPKIAQEMQKFKENFYKIWNKLNFLKRNNFDFQNLKIKKFQ